MRRLPGRVTRVASTYLLLVRHGEYVGDHVPGEVADGDLTERGRRQAQLTARRLAQLPISSVHFSTLRRAVQTTELLKAGVPDVPMYADPVLRECIPSIPSDGILTPDLRLFFDNLPPTMRNGGKEQARAAFARYARHHGERDRYLVLSTHGNLINWFVCTVLNAPEDLWVTVHIHHCGITTLEVREDKRVVLVSHNDIGHLPPGLHTTD
jgi:broad specificity phosphatase PhoE